MQSRYAKLDVFQISTQYICILYSTRRIMRDGMCNSETISTICLFYSILFYRVRAAYPTAVQSKIHIERIETHCADRCDKRLNKTTRRVKKKKKIRPAREPKSHNYKRPSNTREENKKKLRCFAADEEDDRSPVLGSESFGAHEFGRYYLILF